MDPLIMQAISGHEMRERERLSRLGWRGDERVPTSRPTAWRTVGRRGLGRLMAVLARRDRPAVARAAVGTPASGRDPLGAVVLGCRP